MNINLSDFTRFSEVCEAMKAAKTAQFPIGSVVVVASDRYHGEGVVAGDERCPLDMLPVRLCNDNVWWYPIGDCEPYRGDTLPRWVRSLFQARKVKRAFPIDATLTEKAQATQEREAA